MMQHSYLLVNIFKDNKKWKVLIVDDYPKFHETFTNLIDTYRLINVIENIELTHAYSAEETIELLQNDDPLNPEYAVIFLDIVMGYNNAGFNVVDHIRNTTGNFITNIIIITGQAGKNFDTPDKIVDEYHVNGFINKYNLNGEAIITSLLTGIRMFELLKHLKNNLQTLHFTTAFLTNTILSELNIDCNEKDFGLFAENCLGMLAKKHGKDIHSFEPEALKLLAEYSHVSNSVLLRLINDAVIKCNADFISKDDIGNAIYDIESNRTSLSWNQGEDKLKNLYKVLCGEPVNGISNSIKFINRNETGWDVFKTHFYGYKILPKINWLENEKDLLHLIFALDQDNYFSSRLYEVKVTEINEIRQKTTVAHHVLPEHFTLKGKDLKAGSVKTCNSVSVKLVSASDRKAFLSWDPEPANPNYDFIKMIIEEDIGG